MTTNTGYTVSNGNYTNSPDLSTIFALIPNGTNQASPTGYKVSTNDLSNIFEPWTSGYQAPSTGYTVSNVNYANNPDLSSIFAPNLLTFTDKNNVNITNAVLGEYNVIIIENSSNTTTGSCNITFNLPITDPITANYIIVGGGGGGGGGGVYNHPNIQINTGDVLNIIVGNGSYNGQPSQPSQINSYSSGGGGGGGDGASGGDSASSVTGGSGGAGGGGVAGGGGGGGNLPSGNGESGSYSLPFTIGNYTIYLGNGGGGGGPIPNNDSDGFGGVGGGSGGGGSGVGGGNGDTAGVGGGGGGGGGGFGGGNGFSGTDAKNANHCGNGGNGGNGGYLTSYSTTNTNLSYGNGGGGGGGAISNNRGVPGSGGNGSNGVVIIYF
jgi:hypothetical protein